MKAKGFARRSITTHWLINGVGVIIAVLLIIEVLLIVSIRSYYYSSVRQYLSSKMNVITGSILNDFAVDEDVIRINFLAGNKLCVVSASGVHTIT